MIYYNVYVIKNTRPNLLFLCNFLLQKYMPEGLTVTFLNVAFWYLVWLERIEKLFSNAQQCLCPCNYVQVLILEKRRLALRYKRVYLRLCKVADTPFHIQANEELYLNA